MKIYVSHSKNFDFKKELYEVLENSNLGQGFILPHKDSDTPFNTKELFQNKNCDLIIAEVSFPATGQGIELGWADIYKIPVVCIYKKGSKISGSLKIIADKFIEYKNAEDLINKLEEFLK